MHSGMSFDSLDTLTGYAGYSPTKRGNKITNVTHKMQVKLTKIEQKFNYQNGSLSKVGFYYKTIYPI